MVGSFHDLSRGDSPVLPGLTCRGPSPSLRSRFLWSRINNRISLGEATPRVQLEPFEQLNFQTPQQNARAPSPRTLDLADIRVTNLNAQLGLAMKPDNTERTHEPQQLPIAPAMRCLISMRLREYQAFGIFSLTRCHSVLNKKIRYPLRHPAR